MSNNTQAPILVLVVSGGILTDVLTADGKPINARIMTIDHDVENEDTTVPRIWFKDGYTCRAIVRRETVQQADISPEELEWLWKEAGE